MQSNGISKRDQLILFLLGIFLIVVVIGYWGVRPQFRKMASIQNEIEEEEETKRENTMKISQLPMLEAECEEYQKVIDEYQDDFYSVMTSDEIDRMLTSQALSLGLSAYDLEITMPDAPSDRLAYQYSYLYSQQIAAQATAEDQEALGAEDRESPGEPEDRSRQMEPSGAAVQSRPGHTGCPGGAAAGGAGCSGGAGPAP